MNKLQSFNDYRIDQIFENHDTLNLKLSTGLRNVLELIGQHPIANHILVSEVNRENKFKVTFIDFDDSDPKKKDMVYFMNSNKVLDDIIKQAGWDKKEMDEDEWRMVHRQSMRDNNVERFFNMENRPNTKIGRVVGKLFPGVYKQSGEPGKDIESFVNYYKAARDTDTAFELVKGDKIPYWYNGERYTVGGGSLNSSCMRGESCEDYLQLYKDNPEKISMLILKGPIDKEKIRGRAIVWQLSEPSGRTFMDRVYTANDSDTILFENYAKEKGWLHKKHHNMDEGGPWVDTKTGEDVYTTLIVDDLDDPGKGGYPYMDTMKFFDGDTISNDEDQVDSSEMKKLESTEGGFENEGEWSDFYDDYVNEDDMQYCDRGDCYRYEDDCYYSEYYGETIAKDYAEDYMVELDHYDDYDDIYRDRGDYLTTYEGNVCDESYAESHFDWSEYHGEWVEDAVYSDYMEDNICRNDAEEVYTDAAQRNTDWRIDDKSDGHWWTWDVDDENYCDEVSESDLQEENGWLYSEYEEEWIDPDDAVEVFTDADKSETDYRSDSNEDDNWWTWEGDGEKYCMDVTEDDIKEYNDLDDAFQKD